MNNRLLAIIAALTATSIFGLNHTITKSLMPVFVTPPGLLFARVLGACTLFWVISIFSKKEKIQKKEFDNNRFNEMSANSLEYTSLNSINDNNTFEKNSVKILYSLPINSFTLVNDKDNKIYLVRIVSAKDNSYNSTDENYLKFVQELNTDNRKSILQSYDQLLNNKYKVQLNQKTIDRVKNYFK